jgi:hypothetical protein
MTQDLKECPERRCFGAKPGQHLLSLPATSQLAIDHSLRSVLQYSTLIYFKVHFSNYLRKEKSELQLL